jgi:hypothetical protein
VVLTKCGRSGLSGICNFNRLKVTQLSLPTWRSSWMQRISARLTPGSLEDAFRAAPSLRRIACDTFDAEMLKRPSDLGRAGPVDVSAGVRRMKIMAAAIRIEAQR